ncbi:dihydrofolate reductase [Pontibacter sp. HSC-36F09]|uniref:dihydrofolate reductase n=1 Tax=Pontibacter sp. HSC-36F09 TaxID=2910966 RepID=UPI00209EFEF4|nr:dihydrofolate reductase [Pontibacter sp. HSC-36F09]MCP2044602.1 dihydrofolate reductase [Pontibacter sp. HSC-36F09]
MIAIVVAIAQNNVIGKDNQLIWHLPADLRHFKQKTMGHPMIMGRKTFESIGKPLPGRTTIIVTRQEDYKAEGCIVVNSVEEAIAKGKELDSEQVSIVGGAEIYKQALSFVDTIYLTKVHHDFDGDTFFPELKEEEWLLVSVEGHEPDEKNKYAYTFKELRRKV